MEIRKSTESDKTENGNMHIKAFGPQKGSEISGLVKGLMNDRTAAPLFSFVAVEETGLLVIYFIQRHM